MSESALTLAYEDLANSVARYLGYGEDSLVGGSWQTWSSKQQTDVDRSITDAERNFYYNGQHIWSFLRPTTTITLWASATGTMTVTDLYTITDSTNSPFLPTMIGQTIVCDTSENEYTITGYTSTSVVTVSEDASSDTGDTFTITCDGLYQMPDTFGGFVEPYLTFTSQTCAAAIRVVGESIIRRKQQIEDSTGRPRYAAVRNKTDSTDTPSGGQRYELMVWPHADSEYTAEYRFNLEPPSIVDNQGYPIGGPQFTRAFKAACLAAAESEFNDGQTEKQALFAIALAEAVKIDKMNTTPHFMGYNGDHSDGRYGRGSGTYQYVTLEGEDP